MTTPTSNSVPSNNLLDAKFNFEKLDEIINSDGNYFTDRFGKPRLTAKGLESLVETIGQSYNSALGSIDGEKKIGFARSMEELKTISPEFVGQKITLLSYYNEKPPVLVVPGQTTDTTKLKWTQAMSGGGGVFICTKLTGADASEDDGGFNVVTNSGAKLTRVFHDSEVISPLMFGAYNDLANDSSDAFQKCISAAAALTDNFGFNYPMSGVYKRAVVVMPPKMRISKTISWPANKVYIHGYPSYIWVDPNGTYTDILGDGRKWVFDVKCSKDRGSSWAFDEEAVNGMSAWMSNVYFAELETTTHGYPYQSNTLWLMKMYADSKNLACQGTFEKIKTKGFAGLFENGAYCWGIVWKDCSGTYLTEVARIIGATDNGERFAWTDCYYQNMTGRAFTITNGANFEYRGGSLDYIEGGEFSISGGGSLHIMNTHIENTDRRNPIVEIINVQSGPYQSYPTVIHSGGKVVLTGSKTMESEAFIYNPQYYANLVVRDVVFTNNAIDYLNKLKLVPSVNYIKTTNAPRVFFENMPIRISNWYMALTRGALNAFPLCQVIPTVVSGASLLTISRATISSGGAVTITTSDTSSSTKQVYWDVPFNRSTNWETLTAALFFDSITVANTSGIGVQFSFYDSSNPASATTTNPGTLRELTGGAEMAVTGTELIFPRTTPNNSASRLKEMKAYQYHEKFDRCRITLTLTNLASGDSVVISQGGAITL